ncbi:MULTISPECIES: presqualene diphosphate synthase HpnD [Actinomadura]|uniref:Farnesyl-diphosphate farnesyltransferase n=1 Tax=Actinomadura madurae TaxID=1993 RepID=A0A1I5RSE5_9ACTN|nr:presqualene diphosphate synthase HpnD [Actinomadura madurae]SFP61337.1 farnesyl-diphosphate farnesyltransferase [Actinomadura madurae]SPT59150.1 Dehydrosqualene synthase [Actinomadura madurae]
MDAPTAYRHCENVVRSQARNFSYGIRLLPQGKRRALSAVYAFARRIDDIGDDHGAPAAGRLARLADQRARLADLDAHPSDPVLVALADAARRHPIPLEAFGELIDGCEADVRGETYDTFDDLHWYCRCVAGAVGRLSLGVFGTSDPDTAVPRADALGVALQLTNILRDVREDGLNGRVYLPAKDLARFGCTLERDASGRLTDDPERLANLVRFEAARAAEWYGTGLELLPMLDRRSAACAGAMAGIYRQVLRRITADPLAALEKRTSLPAWEKAAVSARAMAGIRR